MADAQIEEVKLKVDIVDLVGGYIDLKRAGRNYKGLCPFHTEKTPSFMVTPELQIYKCFGCGAGGDVFKFVMDYEKMEFGEALKFLAEKVGVKLIATNKSFATGQKEELYQANSTIAGFYHYLLERHILGLPARQYFKERGVEENSIKMFQLGYSPENSSVSFGFLTKKKGYSPDVLMKTGVIGKGDRGYYDRFRGRVMFPLYDHLGNVAGFAGRVIAKDAKTAKYINTPETPVYKKGNLLYGLNITKQEIKKKGFVVVVEGELDCISSYQAGVQNVVAIKGSALTESQLRLLSRFCSKIVLALDSDFAGDEAARRGIKNASILGLTMKVARVAPYKDPDEIARADREAWMKAVNEAQDVYEFLIDSVFNKHDAETTEGKSRISREVSPVIAEIDDEILKAHLIKMVASRLGVGEQAVVMQSQKYFQAKQFPTTDAEVQKGVGTKEENRRELLEKHLLTCILQGDPNLLNNSRTDDLIVTLLARKLYQFIVDQIKLQNKFNMSEISEKLPAELRDYLAIVVLGGSEIEDKELLKREIDEAFRNLETLDIKEKMSLVTQKIKEAERKNDEENLARYERNLAKFTQKLAELEHS